MTDHMTVRLSPEQVEMVRPLLRPGYCILGKIQPKRYVAGMPAETIGELELEVGAVPSVCLPALRDAITKANTKVRKK